MGISLDDIEREFYSLDSRLAVFDRPIRKHVGQWNLENVVSAEDIISRFASHGGFTHDDKVVIPLHESDTPELTGEYIAFLPDDIVNSVIFYDFGVGKASRIPLDRFGNTYPASRVRFWHPNASPAGVPDYLKSTGEEPASQNAIAGVEGRSVEFESVVSDLRAFLNREREAERTEARKQFQTVSIDRYSSIAGAIPRVENGGFHVDEYGQQYFRARLPEELVDGAVDIPDRFGIYPMTEVLLETPDDTRGFPVEAEVLDIEGRDLHLGLYWDRLSPSPAESAFDLEDGLDEFTIGELLNPVPYDRQEEAIELLEEDSEKRGVLTGETTLSFEDTLDVPISEHRLNKSQYQAAMKALQAEQVYCIHGPPGTGKTRTLVEIIRGLAANGNRVLVCAHSNQAVDNILVGDSSEEFSDRSSLHPFIQDEEFTAARAGGNTAIDLVDEEYASADLYQSDVVCTTTSGASQFGKETFDFAILDEATQATIPASLIPMTRAKRLILAGDHKQLPPYHSQEDNESEQFEPSMFEHVLSTYGNDSFSILKTQYRMNEEIARFPNAEFYQGELEHGPKNRTWTIAGLDPLTAYDVAGQEKQTPGNSYYNDSEIDVVSREVGDLLSVGVAAEQIGIITPYSGQRGKITSQLRKEYGDDTTDAIKVDTVDSFQGGERDVVLISFVRSNANGETGFLTFPTEGPRRLNVALSRARKRCVIVGDFDTLTTEPAGHSDASSVFQRLYESLQERNLVQRPEPKANQL